MAAMAAAQAGQMGQPQAQVQSKMLEIYSSCFKTFKVVECHRVLSRLESIACTCVFVRQAQQT